VRIPSHNTRSFPLLAVAVLVLGTFAGSLAWQVPAAQAAGAANAQGRELVRLFNGARAAAGKSALVIDTFLEGKSRDGSIPCPDDAAKSLPGRARDFSETGHMDHHLRQCNTPTYTLSGTLYVNVVQTWGYGSVGEIDLVNGGYGFGQYLYTYRGWQTYTYATTGRALIAWATSSTHWNIVMGAYNRVGCGAWSPSGSTVYYDCVFSNGGPGGTVAAPKTSPFTTPLPTTAPVVTPTPRPAVTAAPPVATPVATPRRPAPARTTSGTKATPIVTAAPTDEPTPVPTDADSTPAAESTAAVMGVQAAPSNAAPAVPAVLQDGGRALGTTTGPLPTDLNRESVLAFLVAAGLLVGFYAVLHRVRRRRRTAIVDR
jgi:hypothetical protein